jgi:hypothetical protein
MKGIKQFYRDQLGGFPDVEYIIVFLKDSRQSPQDKVYSTFAKTRITSDGGHEYSVYYTTWRKWDVINNPANASQVAFRQVDYPTVYFSFLNWDTNQMSTTPVWYDISYPSS